MVAVAPPELQPAATTAGEGGGGQGGGGNATGGGDAAGASRAAEAAAVAAAAQAQAARITQIVAAVDGMAPVILGRVPADPYHRHNRFQHPQHPSLHPQASALLSGAALDEVVSVSGRQLALSVRRAHTRSHRIQRGWSQGAHSTSQGCPPCHPHLTVCPLPPLRRCSGGASTSSRR